MPTEETATDEGQAYLLEWGWTIIANAGGGNWALETSDWQEAAAKWRDQYHAVLGERVHELSTGVPDAD